MCAAISSVLLQSRFDHVTDTALKSETNNRLYESWVNRIDIGDLLKVDDLTNRKQPLIALLNSSVIDGIATYALRPVEQVMERRYVSPQLTLLMSLTNLRGVPYSLNTIAPDSVEQTTFFYGDRIRFVTTTSASTALSTQAHAITVTAPPDDPRWQLLRSAAMATGAFPVLSCTTSAEARADGIQPSVMGFRRFAGGGHASAETDLSCRNAAGIREHLCRWRHHE